MNKTHYEHFLECYDKKNKLVPFFKKIKSMSIGMSRLQTNNLICELMETNMIVDMTEMDIFNTVEYNELFRKVIVFLYHFYYSQNCFDVSLKLIDRLNQTNIDNIDSSFIKLPYDNMYINLPDNIDKSILDININGFYLYAIDPNDYNKEFKSLMEENKFRSIRIGIASIENPYGEDNNGMMDYNTLFAFRGITLHIHNNLDIKSVFDKNYQYHERIADSFKIDNQVRKLVTKLLLYINCSNNNIKEISGFKIPGYFYRFKENSKKRKLLKQFGNKSKFNCKYLDTLITDHNTSNNINSEFIKKISIPQKVRGHFKKVHYGKNKCNVKTIWILEYTRGNFIDYLGSNYKVG